MKKKGQFVTKSKNWSWNLRSCRHCSLLEIRHDEIIWSLGTSARQICRTAPCHFQYSPPKKGFKFSRILCKWIMDKPTTDKVEWMYQYNNPLNTFYNKPSGRSCTFIFPELMQHWYEVLSRLKALRHLHLCISISFRKYWCPYKLAKLFRIKVSRVAHKRYKKPQNFEVWTCKAFLLTRVLCSKDFTMKRKLGSEVLEKLGFQVKKLAFIRKAAKRD